ncbi:MAG: ABC transporter ATP-binding protein [Gemmatimonadaceae bacterium]
MSSAAVIFDHVWKKFQRGERHDSLRDLLPAVARRLVRKRGEAPELEEQEFWALRDLSFEVRPGQALGIIGGNGAGKSTALKLLTRILRPTRGHCELQGRVGALIEVAAGFHPDLTGRENVYLQGAIMGMKRADIARKFDEIVAFSGIADFIDTQVKRYSSGMNARLGFSVAAHLEPDVLLIDEVLAVGDFSFQERAFDRMRAVVKSGVPVVVVSHQLERIVSLCTHALLLDHGRLVTEGTPVACVAKYMSLDNRVSPRADADCPVRIDSAVLEGPTTITSGERITVTVAGVVHRPLDDDIDMVGLQVRSMQNGQAVYATGTRRCRLGPAPVGPFELEIDLQMNLPTGVYSIDTVVWNQREERALAWGPSLSLTVDQGADFWGSVQLNGRMRLLSPTTVPKARRQYAPAATSHD